MENKSEGTLYKGAFLLLVANFFVKIIGILYKVPLTNMVGTYCMGFFNQAFEVQQVFLAFSTAGLPVALSKMVSESNSLGRFRETRKIFRVVLTTFAIVGLVGSLLMFFGSSFFAVIIETPLAKYSLMALAPAMFFLSITAAIRGFFQGHNRMEPTAVTQVIEAVVKVALGIGLAYLFMQNGLGAEYVSAGAILGTTFSTLTATLLMASLFIFFAKRLEPYKTVHATGVEIDDTCRTTGQILKYAIGIIVPITIGSVVVNLTSFLDLFLIMRRLGDIGLSSETATSIYGAYKSCAQTLFNLPPSIITSVNLSFIPAASAAFIRRDRKNLNRICSKAVKLVMIFAVPCSIGLMVFAKPILTLFYPSIPNDVALATPLLRILGFASLWVSISSILTALLQAVGKMKLPLVSMAAGGAVKLIINYILVGIPAIGITGAPVGTALCYVVMAAMNIWFLRKYSGVQPNLLRSIIKPLMAAVAMGGAGYLLYWLLEKAVGTNVSIIISLIFCVCIYFVVLLLIGGITPSDVAGLPGGKKLSTIVAKLSRKK
ncbi:MAG: polysaccharide biosynthesis protein [Ruminococcaceae bacterium]|nr:polysaccharide biosynthesis protein [Oscillospiraceae bacterium]